MPQSNQCEQDDRINDHPSSAATSQTVTSSLSSSSSMIESNSKSPTNNNDDDIVQDIVYIPSNYDRFDTLTSRRGKAERFTLTRDERKNILKDIYDNRDTIQQDISSIDANDGHGLNELFLETIDKFSTKNKRHLSNVDKLSEYIIDIYRIFQSVINLHEGLDVDPPKSFGTILDLMKNVDAQVNRDILTFAYKHRERKLNYDNFYKDARNAILDEFTPDLDDLEDSYEQENINIPFEVTKRRYIEYLFAHVIGSTYSYKTAPPLNVDALWRSHLLETESYRNLEKSILDKFKNWKEGGIDVNHIDHSIVKNREGRERAYSFTCHIFLFQLGFDALPLDLSLIERSSPCRKRKARDGDSDLDNNHEEKNSTQTETVVASDRHIVIEVKDDSNGISVSYKVSGKTRMMNILRFYAEQFNISYSSLRLLDCDGRVMDYQTVNDYKLRDNEILHVIKKRRWE